MIVDVHYHLIPRLSERGVDVLVDILASLGKAMGKNVERGIMSKKALEMLPDPTGERLIASMEESGIDFTCVCATDNADERAVKPETVQAQNRFIGQIAQQNSQRVMALAGVDPRREEAPDMLKQCFEEFGLRGLKYHPDYGFDPGSPESYKLLEIVQEHKGILLTHTGPLVPPNRSKYADPMLLADLAVDFPDLPVIAAHMGQMDWRPWANLAFWQPNLYGDLAMWDVFAFRNYENFCRDLRGLIDCAGVSKVLFGTDNPFNSILSPTKEWIELIRNLPTSAPAGIDFTEDEVNSILGGNAASLLGLV